MHLMVAEHVADILTKKTFNAFPELLHTVDVLLLHSPGAVWRVGRSWLERFDLFLYPKIPRDVCDQVLEQWKCFYRLHRHPVFLTQLALPRPLHMLLASADFPPQRPPPFPV